MATTASQVISFARGVPAPECLAVDDLADCARAALENDGKTILSYGSGAGYTPLRTLLAEQHGVHPSRVILTNGSLNGFVLLARRVARGRTAYVEFPTYDRAMKILLESGASVQSIAIDDSGMLPEDLRASVRVAPGAFIYTIPTFQNPTGRTMSLERRKEIVEISRVSNTPLLEDDPYSLIRFEGEPLPSIFELSNGAAWYSSSFSKTIAPGLRVGWFVLPEDIAEGLTEDATSTYITPVLLAQATVHEFITRGLFEPNLVRINGLLKARRDAMLTSLEKHFSGARFTRPEGGFFIWLELDHDVNAKEVLARAEGVTAVPGPDFGGPPFSMRLAYSFADVDQIDSGIERLAAAV